MWMIKNKYFVFLSLTCFFALSTQALSQDFKIYSVYNPLSLGDENTPPVKDLFINAGANHGLKKGTSLTVYRKISSFDFLQRKHYQDLTVPVGSIKVIHVDSKASIARTEKFLPAEENAGMTAHHFQVGDIVRME